MRAMISILSAAIFLMWATVAAQATGNFGGGGGPGKVPFPQSFGWFEDDHGGRFDDPDYGSDRFGFEDHDRNGGFGNNFHGLICKKIVIVIPRWIPASFGPGRFGPGFGYGFGFGHGFGHPRPVFIKKIVIICRPPFSP